MLSTFDRTKCQTGHEMLLNDECKGECRNDHDHSKRAHAAPVDGEFRRVVEQPDRQRLRIDRAREVGGRSKLW